MTTSAERYRLLQSLQFKGSPSDAYIAVVEALERLRQAEGDEAATRAACEITSSMLAEVFKARAPVAAGGALRRSERPARPCAVVGKHPQRYQTECDACASFPTRLRDHQRLWIAPGRQYVYTTQPYRSVGPADAKALVEWCERWGATFRVQPYSWHFPSRTLLIEIWREGSK